MSKEENDEDMVFFHNMHLIRKSQVHVVEKGNVVGRISFIAHPLGVTA